MGASNLPLLYYGKGHTGFRARLAWVQMSASALLARYGSEFLGLSSLSFMIYKKELIVPTCQGWSGS